MSRAGVSGQRMEPSSLQEQLHALGRIICRIIDPSADGIGHHLVGGIRVQEGLQVFGLPERGIKPGIVISRGQEHRHSHVQGLDEIVRHGRDDGAGVEWLSVRRNPALPQAGKRERPPIAQPDVEGLLVTTLALPFIESFFCPE